MQNDILNTVAEYDIKFTFKNYINSDYDEQLKNLFYILNKCTSSTKYFKENICSTLEHIEILVVDKKDWLFYKHLTVFYFELFNLELSVINTIIDLQEDIYEDISEDIEFFIQNIDPILETIKKANKKIKEFLDV